MRIRLLDQTHPDYDAQNQAEWRALHEGPGKGDGELWSRWLPRRPAEQLDRWNSRKASATYKNEAGGLLDLLTGYLFSTPLVVAGAPNPWWETWLTDVDRQGSAFSPFVADRLTDALVGSAAYALVSLPQRGAVVTNRADEEALGLLDAYLVPWTAEHVLRWGEDEHGRLTWVVAKDSVPVNEFGQELTTKHRWTYVDSTTIRVFEAPDDASPDDDAPEVLTVQHGFGRLPVVRMKLAPTMHAMRRLRDPAVDLLRARTARKWAIEQSAYAMLGIFTDRDLSELKGGEGWWMQFPLDAKAEWLEPGGASLAELASEIETARDDLYRAMHSLTQASHSDSLQGQSGISKEMDWQAFEVVLSGYASVVLDFARDILDLVSHARGEDDTGLDLTGLDGFQASNPSQFLLDATVGEPLLSKSPTAKRMLAKRAVDALLPDLTPEDREIIAAELDVADFESLSVPFALPVPAPA